MSDLKETTLSSKGVFTGGLLDVRVDEVRLPNGKTSTREWIKHPGAAVMIPVLPDGKIGLIRHFRYPVQEELIELPAGKFNSGEEPEKCALRELEEEIGYRAGKLTFIANIHPAVGFASEKMWVFLAEDLEKSEKSPDPDEFVKLLPTTLEKAVRMVWEGQITDGKTIIGIVWAERLLS